MAVYCEEEPGKNVLSLLLFKVRGKVTDPQKYSTEAEILYCACRILRNIREH